MAGQLNKFKRASAGFTLVEVLVVMIIIALAAGVAVLNAPPPPGKARAAADKFAAKLTIAADTAIMSNAMIGVEVDEAAATFYRYFRGEWEPVDSAAFAGGVNVDFEFETATKHNEKKRERSEDAKGPAPTIFFSPTGEATPFKAAFRTRAQEFFVNVSTAGDIEVSADDEA